MADNLYFRAGFRDGDMMKDATHVHDNLDIKWKLSKSSETSTNTEYTKVKDISAHD